MTKASLGARRACLSLFNCPVLTPVSPQHGASFAAQSTSGWPLWEVAVSLERPQESQVPASSHERAPSTAQDQLLWEMMSPALHICPLNLHSMLRGICHLYQVRKQAQRGEQDLPRGSKAWGEHCKLSFLKSLPRACPQVWAIFGASLFLFQGPPAFVFPSYIQSPCPASEAVQACPLSVPC